MNTTLDTAAIEALGTAMDRDARELAHSNVDLPCDGPTFAAAYVRAMAETCGAHAADQVSCGTWEPDNWLPADATAIREAAELVGVTLERSDWRDLFALYRSPSDGAFDVCGLARPVGRWIVEGCEALGAWGWECTVGGGGRIRDAASDTEEEAERDVEALVAQGFDRDALRVREALVMA